MPEGANDVDANNPSPCACTRRRVLQAGLAWAAGPSMAGLVEARGAPREGPRMLVLLQLSGGNDGLNTVIPYRDPLYHEWRPRLGCVARRALPIDDHLALHPSLRGWVRLYERGHLAIVQGVGYAEPDYSHFGSCRIWTTGRTDGAGGAGWWDGALARRPDGAPAIAVSAGPDPPARMVTGPVVRICADGGSGRASTAAVNPLPWYPGQTGHILAAMARLARRERPPRLVFGSIGGFDTHEHQLEGHAQVLSDLGEGLAAFQAELEKRGVAHRVATMIWSEFGRRPAENARGGTDHGSAGPVFLMGGGLRGGLYGRTPSLVDTDFGNLVPTVDFRGLYALLADRWLGLSPTEGSP